jgi:hypothetical protein
MQVLAPERQLELVRTYFDALDEQAGAAAA